MSNGKPQRRNKPFYATEVVPEYHDVYDSVEFDLTTGQTDYDVKTNQAESFVNAPRAHSAIIRTNQTITIKFNSTDDKTITIERSEGSFTITRNIGLEIKNIFITNASGGTAAIKLFLIP